MSQRKDETATTPPHASSSFPNSSPSFWNEAATVAIPSPPIKRARNEVSSPISDPNLFDDFELDLDPALLEIKRPRYGSPGGESRSHTESNSHSTNLSYLPKRNELLSVDDPHSYLTNAEYAPNKFGDMGDYMRKKEVKVQTQNRDIALASAASGIPQIFAGQSFWINGNTHPPMEELRKMILQRGGEVRPKLWNKGYVKFIIAPMLTQSKFKQFERYKVVREGWITESCKEGKMLDWTRWKLQIQGGWEEGGRKGMEGFFKSQPGQTQGDILPKLKELSPSPELNEEENIKKPQNQSENRPSAARVAITTQSLLAPTRAPARPVTPRRTPTPQVKLETASTIPSAIPSPVKAQEPEGWWNNYHTKESNENAAQAMKNDEWRAKNTAERGNEGGFIDGYYQNSRLHHLSTWKAELKVLVADAQRRSEELSLTTPSASTISTLSLANSTLPTARAGASNNSEDKVIFHVDFDCFFVSCGLATRPHLKGKPVVVCHSQTGKGASSTSEIASCSYEARAKGVKNGMSLGRARTLAGDDLLTIPYEFETYKKFSLAFYTILMGYADELQAVSVDEALIDVTSAVNARAMAPEEASGEAPAVDRLDGEIEGADDTEGDVRSIKRVRDPAIEIAEKIRNEVRKVTDGCEVSIGISHNILLAKLATRSAKPAGVAHLLHSDIEIFLAPLDVEDFPSIGYSIKTKIEEKFGTTSVAGLLAINKLALQRVLGPKTGEMLYGYLRGVDERKLEPDKARKSVSAEMNYGIRFRTQEQAEICIADLAAEVSKRMKGVGVLGKQITLKLMRRHPEAPVEPPKFMGHGWCETFNRSSPIAGARGAGPTDDPATLARESVKLLRAMKLDPVELRGVGIQVTKLDSEEKDKKVEREAGQGLLGFQPKRRQGKAERDDTPMRKVEIELARRSTAETSLRGQIGDDGIADVKHSETIREIAPPVITRIPSPQPLPPSPKAGPSRLPMNAQSSDAIDPSFLAALPPELREEVKRDHAQTRAQTRARAASEIPVSSGSAQATSNPIPLAGPSQPRATTISPVKARSNFSKMHEAAHITRQLRPKVKTQLKVAQIAEQPLFTAWTRAQDKGRPDVVAGVGNAGDIVDLTGSGADSSEVEAELEPDVGGYRISELKELDIDPDVFGALPDEMRREVIEEERRKAGRRKMLHRPGNVGSRAGSMERGRSGMSMSVSPAKSHAAFSRGGSTSRGMAFAAGGGNGPGKRDGSKIVINKPAKPTLFKLTAVEDINQVVERWIESRNGSGPAGKDALKVAAFLRKSVDSGLGGVERAVDVLRWMRVLLRDQWGAEEGAVLEREEGENLHLDHGSGQGEAVDVRSGSGTSGGQGAGVGNDPVERVKTAGEEWWITWRGYRDEVVDLATKKFGAGIRI